MRTLCILHHLLCPHALQPPMPAHSCLQQLFSRTHLTFRASLVAGSLAGYLLRDIARAGLGVREHAGYWCAQLEQGFHLVYGSWGVRCVLRLALDRTCDVHVLRACSAYVPLQCSDVMIQVLCTVRDVQLACTIIYYTCKFGSPLKLSKKMLSWSKMILYSPRLPGRNERSRRLLHRSRARLTAV